VAHFVEAEEQSDEIEVEPQASVPIDIEIDPAPTKKGDLARSTVLNCLPVQWCLHQRS
jgi:hypothetical protein